MKLSLMKRRKTDPEAIDDGALVEAHRAALADAMALADECRAEDVACSEVEQAAVDRVTDAYAKKGKAHYESFLANAVLSRLEQQVRSSDAVGPIFHIP